jgi:hypothetical protein
MNRGVIRDRIRVLLGEPTTGGYWTDAQYNSAINDAQRDIAISTKCLKSYAEFSTSAGVNQYDIGESSLDDMLEISEVQFFITSTTYRTLTCISRDELSFMQSESIGTQTYPSYFCYEDRMIEFDCMTPADYNVRVYYYRLPDEMTADADISDIPVKFHDAIVQFVCWQFSVSDDLNPKTGYFKQAYYEYLMKIKSILVPPASTYQGIKDDTEIPHFSR